MTIYDKDTLLDMAFQVNRALQQLNTCYELLETRLEQAFGMDLVSDLSEELTSEKPLILLNDEHGNESVRITISQSGYIEGTYTHEGNKGSWVSYGDSFGSFYEADIIEDDIIFDEQLLTLIENTRMLATIVEGVRYELSR
jgi:hypothetical protein